MRKSQAPLRISFGGGGTDVPPYCGEYGGVCLSVAIEKYAYADYVDENTDPNEMEQGIAKLWNSKCKVKISSDVKPGSGLGGSAALCVAGLKVMPSLEDTPEVHIAEKAYEVERLHMGVVGGYQDQLAAAYGGLLYMQFGAWPSVRVKRLTIPKWFDDAFYLVWMGERKTSGTNIITDQLQRFNKKALDITKQLANEMALSLDNPLDFGHLLREAWEVKKRFSPLVTSRKIDKFCDWVLDSGAIAMKICGAGGGGYALVMEHPNLKGQLELNLEEMEHEKVRFERKGVRLIEEE